MRNYEKKHYEIIDLERELSNDIIRKSSAAYQKNRIFFGKNCGFFKIHIAHTEGVFKKKAGRFYNPWVKGVSLKGKSVVIRSPPFLRRNYMKYGGTPSFEMLLSHEINHIYASQLNLYKGPYWITEGLAMYTAGQIPGKTYVWKGRVPEKRAKELLFYRMIMRKLCQEMYVVHYHGFEYLIKRFGKGKFLSLAGSCSKSMKRAGFEKRFKRVFGISYMEFLKEFLSEYRE